MMLKIILMLLVISFARFIIGATVLERSSNGIYRSQKPVNWI